jgi:hypothetical protein
MANPRPKASTPPGISERTGKFTLLPLALVVGG